MDKRRELIEEFGKYTQSSEEEKKAYWVKRAEETDSQTQTEKDAYRIAIQQNLGEIRQKVLSIRQQIDQELSNTN